MAPLLGFLATCLNAALVERVETTYQNLCASCHGVNHEGGLGGSLVDDQWVHGADDESIARVIREGVTDTGMPGFGEVLGEERIRALVVYLRERAKEAQPPPKPASSGGVFRTEEESYRIETVLEGLDIPWSIVFLPGGGYLVTERPGGLVRVGPDGSREQVTGIPEVHANGQGGMLDVAVPPDFAESGWVYLSFSDPGPDDTSLTAIVRGRIRDGRWVDEEEIFRADHRFYTRGRVHFGCRLVFDGEGHLFFAIGERGRQQDAQDLSKPNGKIHRVNADGSIPEDNPFLGRDGAFPTIYSYGNRNPQGLVLDRETGLLWSTEHGPRGGDELNIIRTGENYGWPVVTFGMNYNGTPITDRTSAPGMTGPVVHWTPSTAVCGLDLYRGKPFPAWDGNLLVGALKLQEVRRVVLDGERVVKQEIIFKDDGRVRDVETGPDGFVYIVLNSPDKIVRLVPAE